MKQFALSYIMTGLGVFVGNWIFVPNAPGMQRTHYDGFMIGLIAFGLMMLAMLIGLALVQIVRYFRKSSV